MTFNRLRNQAVIVDGQERDCHFWTSKTHFDPILRFSEDVLGEVIQFSYDMTFGHIGLHRDHRSGGTHRRKNGELFINTYQGKLAEFGLFQFLRDNGVDSQEPDLSKWGRGAWDTVDLVVQGKKLNVKSTKSKGHLLLLETKDWDKEGRYIPNIPADGGQYDYFLLTRVHPDGDSILRSLRLYYSNEVNGGIDTLRNALLNTAWDFDIAGYVTASDLTGVIHDKIILERGSYLNKFTKMDADNYYVQSGDMKDVAELIELFRRN